MTTMNKGNVFVLVGPSGSGKGTVLKALLQSQENVFLSVSATTRSPRPGEIDGENYFFVTKEEFLQRRDSGGLLEWAEYCENYYGTPKQAVADRIEKGENIILEIEVQGAQSIKEAMPEAITIFIVPPNMEELKRRLTDRKTEDEAVVKLRMETAVREIEYAKKCDYIVVNDIIDDAAARMAAIITAESCRNAAMTNFVEKLIKGE